MTTWPEGASIISTTDLVAWLALTVSLVSAVVTYRRGRADYCRQISYDYLISANRLLEQAFEDFDQARSSQWNGLPEPDRVLWLTVARRITESNETTQKITEDSHRVLCNHARSFWRGKLYDLLRPLDSINLAYFAEDADSILGSRGDQRSSISHKSLRVVIDFLEWPEGMSDPIQDVETYDEGEIDRIRTFRYKAVGDFLEARNAMIDGSDSRRDYWRNQW